MPKKKTANTLSCPIKKTANALSCQIVYREEYLGLYKELLFRVLCVASGRAGADAASQQSARTRVLAFSGASAGTKAGTNAGTQLGSAPCEASALIVAITPRRRSVPHFFSIFIFHRAGEAHEI